MKPIPTDWHGVALAKLTKVMGGATGEGLARSVLEEIAIERVSSASDLRNFAVALARRGGFATAVAALLTLHATMYDEA